MALTKQTIPINFAQGLDTKTDSKQVPIGRFTALQNAVFDTNGRLTKRDGYPKITTLPNTDQTNITTLNDTLLATGSNLYAYSTATNQWSNKGIVQPISLSVKSLTRSNVSQTATDIAVSESGLSCMV